MTMLCNAMMLSPQGSIYIKSSQQGSITIGSGGTSNTVTINAVNTANSVIFIGGFYGTEGTSANADSIYGYLSLTDSHTITATRAGSDTVTSTYPYTIVEFTQGIMNTPVQAGTIAITGLTSSNTATISTVSSNAIVLWLGSTSDSLTAGTASYNMTGVDLTNTTTVTAHVDSTSQPGLTKTTTASYMVLDLTSTVVKSVQKIANTTATSSLTYNSTISAVTAANTILLFNGVDAPAAITTANWYFYYELTTTTNVRATRSGTGTNSKTYYVTVLEFQSGILKSSQKALDTIAAGSSSHGTTVTAVNTNNAILNYAGRTITNATTLANSYVAAILTNSTTVTLNMGANVAAGGTATVARELIEFN